MDADELRKTLKRLDAMSDRCDYVISRNRPLTPDPIPQRRPVRLARPPAGGYRAAPSGPQVAPHPIASGQLAGNEMRLSNGYSPRSQQHDDCDPDGMWANFESEFDDMVAGMR